MVLKQDFRTNDIFLSSNSCSWSRFYLKSSLPQFFNYMLAAQIFLEYVLSFGPNLANKLQFHKVFTRLLFWVNYSELSFEMVVVVYLSGTCNSDTSWSEVHSIRISL